MGCTGSREELTPEESALVSMENMLQYNQATAQMVDYCHRKYSTGLEINSEQWRDIVLTLRIKADNTAQNKKVVDFFNSFKGSDSKFGLRHLLVLGIMLSNGAAKDKARLLFETRDQSDSKNVPKSEILGLVSDMIDISVARIPILFVKLPTSTLTEDDIRKYLNLLNQSKEKAKEVMAQRFIGIAKANDPTVLLQNFLKSFEDLDTQKLLTPTGIRSFVLKQKPSAATTSKFAGLLSKKKPAEAAPATSAPQATPAPQAPQAPVEERKEQPAKIKDKSGSSSEDKKKKNKV